MGSRFGQVMRCLRGDATVRAFARRANISASYVSMLEKGDINPSVKLAISLDRDLAANGGLLTAFVADAIENRNVPSDTPIQQNGFVPTLVTDNAGDEDGEDATNRRRMLQLATVAAVGTVIDDEATRRRLNETMGARRSLDEWSTAHEDHLHALRTRPPAQVAHDLSIDLDTLSRQIQLAQGSELVELHRVTALLAAIQANAYTRMAHHGTALRWWETARWAADASRDLDIRLLVRAEEAGHGLYGQRSPQSVLRLLTEAEHLAGDRPMLKLAAIKAKALSKMGRHAEAEDAMRRTTDLAVRGVRGDAQGFWTPTELHFSQSWVYAAMGREEAAARAREELLRLTSSYVYETNIQLHAAWAAIVSGGVEQGASQAATTIASVPEQFRTVHVLETARMTLRAVPIEHRTHRAVGELRAILSDGA